MEDELIKDLEDLKRRATKDPETDDWMECFITLNGGVRSGKRMMYYPDTDTFDIHNKIDDTYLEDVPTKDLDKKTHIIEALEKNALFENDYSVESFFKEE